MFMDISKDVSLLSSCRSVDEVGMGIERCRCMLIVFNRWLMRDM